jgi:hypothetical protein
MNGTLVDVPELGGSLNMKDRRGAVAGLMKHIFPFSTGAFGHRCGDDKIRCINVSKVNTYDSRRHSWLIVYEPDDSYGKRSMCSTVSVIKVPIYVASEAP